MSELKRKRSRAIIINNSKMVSMYREFNDRKFYVFPGGGMEGNETEEECVIREVYEEFGTGVGEEFDVNSNKEGVYIPKLIKISDIPNVPLMPPEVASYFYENYTNNGLMLRNDIKHILVDNNAGR